MVAFRCDDVTVLPSFRLVMFALVKEVSPMTLLKQRMLEDLRIRNYVIVIK
jgi:hypothetical protein